MARPDPSAVEVWRVRCPEEAPLADRAHVLDASERSRAERLVSGSDRRRLRTAHTALRIVLGDRLGTAPADIRLGRAPCPLCAAPHGRPVLIDHADVHFSLTHCRGLVLVAVSELPVGVDAEPTDRSEVDALRGALHPDEQPALALLPPGEERGALLTCWVRKEAYLKGLGTGLGIDPATVAVGAAPGPVRIGTWVVMDVGGVGSTHRASVAVDVGSAAPPAVVVRDLAVDGG